MWPRGWNVGVVQGFLHPRHVCILASYSQCYYVDKDSESSVFGGMKVQHFFLFMFVQNSHTELSPPALPLLLDLYQTY